MKKLLLFDVDGTLTESGKIIDDRMLYQLQKMNEKGFHLGIVGGGKIEKILTQLKNTHYINHYFTECGCVYHKNIGNNILSLENIYTKNIRNHNELKYLNNLCSLIIFVFQMRLMIDQIE